MWNWMFLNVLMRLRFANVTSWRVTLTGSIGSSYGIHFAQCSVVDGFICSIDSYFYPTCTWNNFLFLTWIFNYYGLLVCIMWRVTSTESTGSSYFWLAGSSYFWLAGSSCLWLTGSSYLWLTGSSYLWLTICPNFSDRWLYLLKSILLLPNFRMKIFCSHLNF